MRLPWSLTCPLAPFGLSVRQVSVTKRWQGLFAVALALSPLPPAYAQTPPKSPAQVGQPRAPEVELSALEASVDDAKAFAAKVAQDPAQVELDFSKALAHLVRKRSASAVDYANVLAEIGIKANQANPSTRAWLPELLALPKSRISDQLQPVFADLIVTAATLHWIVDKIRDNPERKRQAFATLMQLHGHHRGAFATGVDDAIERSAMWAVPTLMLVQSNLYEQELPQSTQDRVPHWLDAVHAYPLIDTTPSRIENAQVLRDLVLGLAATHHPQLPLHLRGILGHAQRTLRQSARDIARWILAPQDPAHKLKLDPAFALLGADPAKIQPPPEALGLALARALGFSAAPPDTWLKELKAKEEALDETRREAWRAQVRKANETENVDRLSGYFAQNPGDLIDTRLVNASLQTLDKAAAEHRSRGNKARASELWARAHAIAQSYEIPNYELYARKRDDAMLEVPSLTPHARTTLTRSVRPGAAARQYANMQEVPGWKAPAAALFGILMLPGIWTFARRRII